MAIETDLLILGGGTGGYVAAIRAAQKGLQVVLVEKDKLGGTCLHKGCIPTKALLKSAEVFDTLKKASDFGIDQAGDIQLNFARVLARKEAIIAQLYQGVTGLMKKNKIKVIHGTGAVLGPSIFSPVSGAVAVTFADPDQEEEIYVPKKLLIATGSKPISLASLSIDEKQILSSDGMLDLKELPHSIAIIGGGVIGVEWASLLNSFGVEVTIFEALDRLVATESEGISKELKKQLEKQGVRMELNQKVEAITKRETEVELRLSGSDTAISVEKVMVAIGRQPNVEGIGLQNTSVTYDQTGIKVNEHYQTTENHIYAVGDCIPTLQLAHVAMREAELAVEHMVEGTNEPLHYVNVPRCIYTNPEIASVGYNRETIPPEKKIKIGMFHFSSNGKALIQGDQGGFVEVIRDESTDDLLGVSLIGPHATDLISEVSTAMYLDATPLEIGEAIHPHPTLSEAIQEAALDSYQAAIHK